VRAQPTPPHAIALSLVATTEDMAAAFRARFAPWKDVEVFHGRWEQLPSHDRFQGLKDELRRDAAIALLTGSDLPVAAIAERVGFSEASAFQRAFRGWTGLAPGRFRRG
jgi:hypothetical protein